MAGSSKSAHTRHICQLDLPAQSPHYIVSATFDKRNKPVGVICNKSRHVQILYDDDVKITYSCTTSVKDVSFDYHGTNIILWIATTSGNVHRISLPSLRTGKKKGKGKSSKQSENCDIFGDLLRNESSSVALSSTASSVVTVGEDSLVLSLTSQIETFQVLETHVVFVSQAHSGWLLSVYHKPNLDKREELNPMKTSYFPSVAVGKASENDESSEVLSSRVSPILYCVKPTEVGATEGLKWTNGSCVMNKNVFNKLFGEDANILECPVIVLALPDGQVYALPVRDLPTGGAFPSRHLLCHLHQAPVGLQGVHLPAKQEETTWTPKCEINSLLVWGQCGKLLVIAEDGDGNVEFKELQTQSPVVHVGAYHKWVFHSTGKDLLRTTLQSLRCCLPYQYVNSSMCGIHSVVAFCVLELQVPSEPVSEDHPVNILLVTNKNNVCRVEVDIARKPCWGQGGQHSGHQLRELLTSIQQVSARLGDVQKQLGKQDTVLTQLGLASAIASGNTPSDLPFSLSVIVMTQDLGSHMEYQVVVRLTNQSPIMLETGWSLCVSLQTEGTAKQNHWHVTRYKSLQPMACGQFTKVRVTVPPSALEDLPIIVSTVMGYCPQTSTDLSESSHKSHSVISNISRCVPVNFPVKRLDIMDFLDPSSTSSQGGAVMAQQTDQEHFIHDLTCDLKCLASKQPGWSLVCQGTSTEDASEPPIPHFSAYIHLAPSTVRRFTGKENTNEISLLRRLVTGSNLQDSISQSQIKAVSPGYHQVSLSVKIESETRNIAVSIQTPNLQLLCQLRCATLHRIMASQKANEKEDDKAVQELRRVLQEIENINYEAASLQEAFQGGCTYIPTNATKQAMRLYERLRKIKITL